MTTVKYISKIPEKKSVFTQQCLHLLPVLVTIAEYLPSTEVPEIQDVEGPKRIAPPPPPTGQTIGPKCTIFGRDSP